MASPVLAVERGEAVGTLLAVGVLAPEQELGLAQEVKLLSHLLLEVDGSAPEEGKCFKFSSRAFYQLRFLDLMSHGLMVKGFRFDPSVSERFILSSHWVYGGRNKFGP